MLTGKPTYRYLRGYALDPGFSTRLDTVGINEAVYRIPFEPLEAGPSGEYVDVVDFDPATGCWYEPVDLRLEEIASQQGLAPSEGSPQFHQQFVYSVAMKTIRHFEQALGRRIVWPPQRDQRGNYFYVAQLRIYPHAIRDANAYYDPDKKALLFGYFEAANQALGANFPGGLVFTCLSPDIVAHETTHAILDAIHHRYMEDTNPDVAAFHEGFADVVALLQRFTFRDLIADQLFRSGGRIDGYTLLGELATQFGEALEGNRGALRSMIGRWNDEGKWEPLTPSPADYTNNVEAHDRGAVLVATIFDAFRRIYEFRTRDLFRIAGHADGRTTELSRDLVERLAREAAEIAEHLLNICIRALDYCPPVDIGFGDYFRALITADLDFAPEDENGYRVAFIEAFRARGIFPQNVNTLSVESLRWNAPDFSDGQAAALSFLADLLKPNIAQLLEASSREELYDRSRAAQGKLHQLIAGKQNRFKPVEWESFLNKLGLTAKPAREMFGAEGKDVQFMSPGAPPPIEVHTIRPAFRAGREGRQVQQLIVTLTQSVTVNIGTKKEPDEMRFRGGCSLIFTLGRLNSAEYVVVKSVNSYRRFAALRDYFTGESGAPQSLSMYASGRDRNLDFCLLHHP